MEALRKSQVMFEPQQPNSPFKRKEDDINYGNARPSGPNSNLDLKDVANEPGHETILANQASFGSTQQESKVTMEKQQHQTR